MIDHQQPPERPVFVLRIEGRPGADNIKSLRWVLKRLLRRYGLKCLDAREVRDPPDDPGRS
jgi:hypothetical protein